jgi:iron complex outermembrane receptor protein
MKANFTKRVALAATAMGIVLSTPAFAQDEASATTADEDTGAIVVTARRVEEKLQDVPISISVFSQQAISNRNIVNAADLGTYTPSLTTNSKFGNEKASFVIRGFVQDLATAPSVGVYFADVVGPRSGGSTTSGNGVGIGSLFDLQNVQVLKGPQGTLFGRNTTGGAVLLVPNKPTDKLDGYVEGSAGNYDMWRLQGVLNVPLSDTFKVRLGVDHMERDGYLKNHSGVGPDRLGNVNYIAARLGVVANLTPDLENYTLGTYSRSDNNGIAARVVGCDRSVPAAPTPPATLAARSAYAYLACQQVDRQNARGDGWWDVENNEPNAASIQTTWQAINTTTWNATDTLTIKNIASYAEFYETTRYGFEGEFFPGATPGTTAFTVLRLNNTPGYNNSSQSTFTEELQFQGRSGDGKLRWQAGGYYESSDPIGYTSQSTAQFLNCTSIANLQCAASAVVNVPVAGGGTSPVTVRGNISQPFQKTWFRDKGLYAQATYNFTDQLALTGGLRYTWDRQTHRYEGVSIAFPTANNPSYSCSNVVRLGGSITLADISQHQRCAVTFTAKSDAPTWLIDLDYKPTNDILLYAKWARGYRAGGAASANVGLETWQPEKVDTYEIGAKTSFRNSFARGYFNLAAFYNDFRDQQIQATLVRNPRAGNPFVGGSAIVNAGKSRIWGIELDTAVTLFEQFRIDGGYTYLNTKVLDLTQPTIPAESLQFFNEIKLTAVKGGPLSLSPEHRLSVTGTYTLPLDSSIGRISLGATYVYTAEQIASLATAPQFQKLPATNLLNLNASWNDIMGKPVDLSFFMTNATNEKFPLNVNNAYTSFGFESQIVNEPRMFGFRLRYRFGN